MCPTPTTERSPDERLTTLADNCQRLAALGKGFSPADLATLANTLGLLAKDFRAICRFADEVVAEAQEQSRIDAHAAAKKLLQQDFLTSRLRPLALPGRHSAEVLPFARRPSSLVLERRPC